VDEFDFLVEDTMRHLAKRFSGFTLFGETRNAVMRFRETARNTPAHVWLTALEKPPKTKDDGTKVKGGPALTGDLPEKVPAMCDLVLRGSRDPLRRPWPGIYRIDVNSSDWVGKDRDNGTPDPAPMNIGEIARFNGYPLARRPDMAWQEPVVQRIHEILMAAPPDDEMALVKEWYTKLLGQNIIRTAAYWTLRDAVDRTTLVRAAQAKGLDFYA
jgi:hypothetical protein